MAIAKTRAKRRQIMRVEDRMLIKNLAHTAEIVNTINGGMTEPVINIDKKETEWIVKVRVPGVSAEHLKIEVRDYEMFLFHIISEETTADIELPYLLSAIKLTSQVDFDGIMAEYQAGELSIHLPLDETASGYERDIEIFKK
jgi:HSP20 family molecular chaperone IbpA